MQFWLKDMLIVLDKYSKKERWARKNHCAKPLEHREETDACNTHVSRIPFVKINLKFLQWLRGNRLLSITWLFVAAGRTANGSIQEQSIVVPVTVTLCSVHHGCWLCFSTQVLVSNNLTSNLILRSIYIWERKRLHNYIFRPSGSSVE